MRVGDLKYHNDMHKYKNNDHLFSTGTLGPNNHHQKNITFSAVEGYRGTRPTPSTYYLYKDMVHFSHYSPPATSVEMPKRQTKEPFIRRRRTCVLLAWERAYKYTHQLLQRHGYFLVSQDTHTHTHTYDTTQTSLIHSPVIPSPSFPPPCCCAQIDIQQVQECHSLAVSSIVRQISITKENQIKVYRYSRCAISNAHPKGHE